MPTASSHNRWERTCRRCLKTRRPCNGSKITKTWHTRPLKAINKLVWGAPWTNSLATLKIKIKRILLILLQDKWASTFLTRKRSKTISIHKITWKSGNSNCRDWFKITTFPSFNLESSVLLTSKKILLFLLILSVLFLKDKMDSKINLRDMKMDPGGKISMALHTLAKRTAPKMRMKTLKRLVPQEDTLKTQFLESRSSRQRWTTSSSLWTPIPM